MTLLLTERLLEDKNPFLTEPNLLLLELLIYFLFILNKPVTFFLNFVLREKSAEGDHICGEG